MKKIEIAPGTIINNWSFVGDTSERRFNSVVGIWKCLCCGSLEQVVNASVIREKSTKCVACGHAGRKIPPHLLSLDRKRRNHIPFTIDEAEKYKQYRKETKAKSQLSIKGRAGVLFRHARKRAKHCGFDFNLNVEWVQQKLEVGVCEATGVLFDFGPPTDGQSYNWFAPSIDRVDSSKGYVMGNVRMTTWRYNSSKNSMSDKEFYEFCTMVYMNKIKHKISMEQ